MTEPTRQNLVTAARLYLGTPWVHLGRARGIGVDCGGLLWCAVRDLGLTFPDLEQYSEVPDGRSLKQFLDGQLGDIHLHCVRPGDMLLMEFQRGVPQHVGLVAENTSGLTLIHSFKGAGKVIEHRLVGMWLERVVASYAIPGVI